MGEPRERTNLERSLFEVPKEVRRYRSWLVRFSVRSLLIGVAVVAAAAVFEIRLLMAVGFIVALWSAGVLPAAYLIEKYGSRRRLDVSAKQFVIDDGRGRSETYLLSNVEHVRLIWIPYVYSRLKLHMTDGRTLVLTPGWDRFDYVLDTLRHAQPTLTQFARYDKYRIHCIAADHRRSRAAENANARQLFWLVSKFMIAPLFATLLIIGLKALGLGAGMFPQANVDIVNDAFFASMMLWALVATAEEVTLHRAQIKKLLMDPMHVRRDLLGEKKLRHTFGIESWMAFWIVMVVTCLAASFGIS